MKIKISRSSASVILFACIAGLSGVFSQQQYGIWPLIFVFVSFQIYFLENFRKLKSKEYKVAFITSWVIYAVGMCSWLSLFGVPALIAFVAIQIVFAYLFFEGITRVPIKLPIFIIYPFCWVVFEFIQANLPYISFSWLTYSTTLVQTPISQIARIGGGALLTFTIVFVSVFIFMIFDYFNSESKSTKEFKHPLFVLTFILLISFYFLAPITLHDTEGKKLVTTIQGNDKNRYLTQEELEDEYIENSHLDLASQIDFKSDVLIFPESAFNDDPEDDEELKSALSNSAKQTRNVMVLNSIATENNKDFNRNYFYDNKMNLLGTYDKKRLVPFGEYVPLDSLIGSWSIFDEIGTGFSPGAKDETIRGVTTLICFESAFSSDVRQALNKDSRLLVITTNNRSYQRTGNSVQHRTLTQLRSIENGIASVHASVSGSSALIERDGKIVSQTELFERTVISEELSWGRPDSIYAKIGDWLSLLALLVVIYLYLSSKGKSTWRSRTSKK